MDNYVNFITSDGGYAPQMNLKTIQGILPKEQFMRVHKSYIISLKKIKHYKKSEVKTFDTIIPIGRTHQEAFLKRVGEL